MILGEIPHRSRFIEEVVVTRNFLVAYIEAGVDEMVLQLDMDLGAVLQAPAGINDFGIVIRGKCIPVNITEQGVVDDINV